MLHNFFNIIISGREHEYTILKVYSYKNSFPQRIKWKYTGSLMNIFEINTKNYTLFEAHYNLTDFKIPQNLLAEDILLKLCHKTRSINKKKDFFIKKEEIITINFYKKYQLPKFLKIIYSDKIINWIHNTEENNLITQLPYEPNIFKKIQYLTEIYRCRITIPLQDYLNCTFCVHYKNLKMSVESFEHNFSQEKTYLICKYSQGEYKKL